MAVHELTKEAATNELIDDLTAKALNDPREKRPPQPWEAKIDENGKGDVAAAYTSGLHDGSTAVARRWVETDAASALRYFAGLEALEELAEEEAAKRERIRGMASAALARITYLDSGISPMPIAVVPFDLHGEVAAMQIAVDAEIVRLMADELTDDEQTRVHALFDDIEPAPFAALQLTQIRG